MGRTENRIFTINDQLEDLAEEERLVEAELEYHRHIADDAERDAVLSEHPVDKQEAGATAADVRRFERRLEEISRRRSKLVDKRAKLLEKLD